MSLVGSLSSSYVDSIIPISGNVIISNAHDGQFPGWPGADVGFFVSGSIGSSGGTDRNTSLFGGDLIVSGNLGLKKNLSVDGDMTVLGTLTTINSVNLEVYDSVVGFGFSSGTIARPAGDRGWVGGIDGSDNVGLLWKDSAGEFAAIRTESSATGSLDVKSYANFHAARGTFTELTGSLTRLSDGSPFIVAMSSSVMAQTGGISISTGSLGQITASYYVFGNDLKVSLSNGKRFGRYGDGDTIPATGKTPAEVIKMAIVEPITPLVSISSPTTILLNQPNPSVTINYSHTIKSLDAGVSTAVLEWKRAGVVGGTNDVWTQLATQTANTGSWTFTHNITDGSTNNTNPIYYRYVVIDTVGATATAATSLSPVYNAPTVSGVIVNYLTNPSRLSPPPDGSTTTYREIGDVGSELIFSINKNANYVSLTGYTLQYRTFTGSWTSWSSITSGVISDTTTVTRQHTPSEKSATQIQYQVVVTDNYTTTTLGVTTINLYPVAFYGSSSARPDSSTTRNLPGYRYVNGTPTFSFPVGNVYNYFTIAIPVTHQLTEVHAISDSTGGDVKVFPGPDDEVYAYKIDSSIPQIYCADASTLLNYKVYILHPASPFTALDTRHVVNWSTA